MLAWRITSNHKIQSIQSLNASVPTRRSGETLLKSFQRPLWASSARDHFVLLIPDAAKTIFFHGLLWPFYSRNQYDPSISRAAMTCFLQGPKPSSSRDGYDPFLPGADVTLIIQWLLCSSCSPDLHTPLFFQGLLWPSSSRPQQPSSSTAAMASFLQAASPGAMRNFMRKRPRRLSPQPMIRTSVTFLLRPTDCPKLPNTARQTQTLHQTCRKTCIQQEQEFLSLIPNILHSRSTNNSFSIYFETFLETKC